MEKNATFLITGATGFIGRHLVEELGREDCHIRCLVRRDVDKGLWKSRNITTILGDLLDKQSLERAIGKAKICIHLASIMNSKDKSEFGRVNIQGMANTVKVSLSNNIKKFIYVSSIDAEVNSHSLYGRTKLAAEEILKNSSLNYTILRPAVAYGEYDDKNITSLINVIKYSPLVPIIGDGKYKRQPIYVGDLIYTIKRCIELEHSNGKTYNVGGPSVLSMNEIVQIIQKVLKKKRLIIHLPLTRIQKLYSFFCKLSKLTAAHIQQVLSIEKDKMFDISDARKELNFKPIEFEYGLRIMFEELNKDQRCVI